MRVLSATALALALYGSAAAQTGEREIIAPTETPKITLAAKHQAAPGQPFRVPCTHNCRWFEVECPAGVVLLPKEWVSGTDLVGYATEGAYTLICRGSLNDVRTEARCALTVSAAPPVPPSPPAPNPGPTPPAPVPPAPVPTDPLAVDLAKLFKADASPDKRADAVALAGVYRSGARILRDQPASFPTVGDLFGRLREASNFALSKKDALESVRNRLRDEHATVFPQSPVTPFDNAMRTKAIAYFGRVALALEGLR